MSNILTLISSELSIETQQKSDH